MTDDGLMTLVNARLLAAVPVLGLALALAPAVAYAAPPETCNGSVDVAVGTPRADVNGLVDSGSATIAFEGDAFGVSGRTIDESTFGGTVAAGNRFGASVAWGFDASGGGCSIVAIGAPGADEGKGKVYVFLVDEDGPALPAQVLSQDTDAVGSPAEVGDNFGSSLHFGGDLFVSWLAIGSPNEDIGSALNAGMVHVLPYDTSNFTGTGSVAYWQGQGGVGGGVEADDHFGASLGAGRNVWSLWVGAPEEDIGTTKDAGVIADLPGSFNGTTLKLPGTTGTQSTITQDSSGVPGAAETGDHFGAVLSALVGKYGTDRQPVIGVPGENIGSLIDAGNILVAYGDKTWASFQQGTKGTTGSVDGTAERGDKFGASLSTYGTSLLIGAPGEDVGSIVDAGAMHLMWASGSVPKLNGSREQSLSQSSTNVAGSSESGDRFGGSVAFGVNGAVIGAPGEDVGAVVDAGSVVYLPYVATSLTKVTGTGSLGLHAGNFGGSPETGAQFGAVAYSITY